MSENWKEEIFKPEIGLLQSDESRKVFIELLNLVPERFFYIAASSSGKYHPACANEKPGGLIKHTLRLIYLVQHMADAWKLPPEEKDALIIAGLIHDIGKENTRFDKDHAQAAYDLVKDNEKDFIKYASRDFLTNIKNNALNHMGPFGGKELKDRENFSLSEHMMYLADYLASRKHITLPVDERPLVIPEKTDESN